MMTAINTDVCLSGLCTGLFGAGVCCLLNIIITSMYKIILGK